MKRTLLLVALFGVAAPAAAQAPPPDHPSKEQLAHDNNLFLSLAKKTLKWEEPADAVRILGPLYFVGTKGLASSCSRPPRVTCS